MKLMGLRSRGLFASLLVACVIFVGQLIYIAYQISPERLVRIDEAFLLDNQSQDRFHNSLKAIRVRKDYDPNVIKIFALGGSAVRDLPEDDKLSSMISKYVGREVLFFNFGGYSQDFLQSYMLAASLPKDEKTIVIVGLTINRFRPKSRLDVNDVNNIVKIPLVWEYAYPELRKIAEFDLHPFYIGFADKKEFVKRRFSNRSRIALKKSVHFMSQFEIKKTVDSIAELWSATPFQQYQDEEGLKHSIDKQISKKRSISIPLSIQAYRENKEANYEMLEHLFDTITSSGAQGVILLGPWSPLAVKHIQPMLPEITEDLSTLFRKYGSQITLLTSDGIYIDDDDFLDLVHLTKDGRKNTTIPFSIALAELVDKLDSSNIYDELELSISK